MKWEQPENESFDLNERVILLQFKGSVTRLPFDAVKLWARQIAQMEEHVPTAPRPEEQESPDD